MIMNYLGIFSQKYELAFGCLDFGVIWDDSSGGLAACVLSRGTKFSNTMVRFRVELWKLSLDLTKLWSGNHRGKVVPWHASGVCVLNGPLKVKIYCLWITGSGEPLRRAS